MPLDPSISLAEVRDLGRLLMTASLQAYDPVVGGKASWDVIAQIEATLEGYRELSSEHEELVVEALTLAAAARRAAASRVARLASAPHSAVAPDS